MIYCEGHTQSGIAFNCKSAVLHAEDVLAVGDRDWSVMNDTATLACIGGRVGTYEHCLVRRGENRNRALGEGMSFVPGVFAPALSEGARGATVRRSRPTPCRQPEHRSHQTRSAAAARFARCIIEDSY